MADYLVTGKKGNGKSLVCVGRIADALRAGRPVATNLDIDVSKLVHPRNKSARLIRLPDKPTAADLELIGIGNPDKAREDRNGLLVLDELATWLNSRTFGDKDRQGVLDWLVHSRKLGWDTYLICQNPTQIDKQIRESLCEYLVICRRMDRLKIPLLGIKMPRVHMAFVKFGMDRDSMLADRWIYRGNDLFDAYDTRQVFRSDYPHGAHSIIPPGYLEGRHWKPWHQRLRDWWNRPVPAYRSPDLKPKPKRPEVARLMELPADQRVAFMRSMGLCDTA